VVSTPFPGLSTVRIAPSSITFVQRSLNPARSVPASGGSGTPLPRANAALLLEDASRSRCRQTGTGSPSSRYERVKRRQSEKSIPSAKYRTIFITRRVTLRDRRFDFIDRIAHP
jgi:hypothetical protein